MEEQKPSMPTPQKGESVFSAMPPKFAFWAGIVAATAVISLVGFGIMLYILLSGTELGSKTKTTTTTTTNAAANTNAAAADPTPSGTIDSKDVRNVTGKGDFTLLEFSDLDCPFCKQFHPTVEQILKDYDGKVKVAFMHFPLSIHPGAQGAAEAAECAAEQGKFWEFVNDHFTAQSTNMTADQHADAAEKLGMNKDKFKKCLADGTGKSRITSDAAMAQKFGAQGTPYSLILDKKGNIVGSINGALPIAQVKATLDGLVK